MGPPVLHLYLPTAQTHPLNTLNTEQRFLSPIDESSFSEKSADIEMKETETGNKKLLVRPKYDTKANVIGQ